MSIYSQKIIWKRILFISALLIVGGSFWYTNQLVQHIASEERKQVQLWAQAIEKKAKLVNYTNKLFRELQDEERKKAELWSEATKTLISSNDISLALKVVESNTTIPIIVVDEKDNITGFRNIRHLREVFADSVPPEKRKTYQSHNDSILNYELSVMKERGNRIEVNYYGSSFNYLYYKDSRLFVELKNTFNDLQTSFISEIVSNAAATPVLFITESHDSIIAYGNIPESDLANAQSKKALIERMKNQNEAIYIDLGDEQQSLIYYEDSDLLMQLKYYPFVQFFVIGLFILIAYWLFSTSRRSEQNQVWVGMSKETAHQLGTPLSSLMGWIAILKDRAETRDIAHEMEKDLERLEIITDRFSKIGSKPNLKEENVVEVVNTMIDYLKNRAPSKISFSVHSTSNTIMAELNTPLFGWVIENLCKNAMDAIEGAGEIRLDISTEQNKVIIDLSDTGKGIPASKKKQVFEPGYTSKKRGWGLGLSLSKRIIENYHHGKIFVKWSEPGKGTTFRIVL